MKNILYISYTGMLEPLGESQVLNYLVRLSKNHAITVLSFEKPDDLKKQKEVDRVRSICKQHSIQWVRKSYHRRPRLLATVVDLATGVLKGVKICRKLEIDLVHARGHVPALMAHYIKKITGVPFIFDMRAFWPEEMLNAGRIKKESVIYKTVKSAETLCLKSCDQLITLTNAALEHLEAEFDGEIGQKTTVIPTCVNLDYFSIGQDDKQDFNTSFTLGIVGTISGWVDLKRMLLFYKTLKRAIPEAELSIFSRDDPKILQDATKRLNMDLSGISIHEVPFRRVPKEMQKMDAGIFCYKPHISEKARSPTKMGEFLACGVPCVANTGVGDVEQILKDKDVGVLIDSYQPEDMENTIQQLLELLKNPDLQKRCRHTAEEWFSLKGGVEKYHQVYQQLS
jgi:glycosyltransferase involved in cell wall biosynthesis